MYYFRWHRGSLTDSLKTAVKINDFDDLVSVIRKELSDFIDVLKEDITVRHYGYDSRLSEETYIVELNNYGVLGFTNHLF